METADYCSYELSKALKACGFDEPCQMYYTHEDAPDGAVWLTGDPCNPKNYNGQPDDCPLVRPICSAPSLYAAQKWLREKWGIYAYCEPNCLKKWFARAIDLAKNEDLLFDGEMFDNFEKATEYAISAALELIKE